MNMLEWWKRYEQNVHIVDVKIMFIMYNFYLRYYIIYVVSISTQNILRENIV